jgi:hypothetical protein
MERKSKPQRKVVALFLLSLLLQLTEREREKWKYREILSILLVIE